MIFRLDTPRLGISLPSKMSQFLRSFFNIILRNKNLIGNRWIFSISREFFFSLFFVAELLTLLFLRTSRSFLFRYSFYIDSRFALLYFSISIEWILKGALFMVFSPFFFLLCLKNTQFALFYFNLNFYNVFFWELFLILVNIESLSDLWILNMTAIVISYVL